MRQEILLDLADATQATGNSLSKAQVLCQELCERYFKSTDHSHAASREHQGFIIWEYRRYALYAYIMMDYLLQMETGIAKVAGMLAEHIEAHRESAAQD